MVQKKYVSWAASLAFFAVLSGYLSWRFIPKNYGPVVRPEPPKQSVSWSGIVKYPNVLNKNMEGTPFVWGGELLNFVSDRQTDAPDFRIYTLPGNELRVTFGRGQNLGLGSAFVDGATLYAFGTRDWQTYGKSTIFMIKSDNLQTFSEPVSVYQAPERQQIFNSSVTKNSATGQYVMAIETTTKGELTPFTIYFLTSSDLTHWTPVPNAVFGKDTYVASPTIKFIDNFYYLWFLSKEYNDPNCVTCTTFVTKLARSRDLLSWTTSPHAFLVPDRSDEGINTSDVDLVEFGNAVYILYAIGDQDAWSSMRYAVYNGSLSSLVLQFFPY